MHLASPLLLPLPFRELEGEAGMEGGLGKAIMAATGRRPSVDRCSLSQRPVKAVIPAGIEWEAPSQGCKGLTEAQGTKDITFGSGEASG